MNLSHKTHGLITYALGFLTIASPWIFGFVGDPAALHVAVSLGGGLLALNLLTNYEMGVIPLLPFAGHRFFAAAIGFALAGSSWHFGMKGAPMLVFTVLGIVELVSVAMTRRPKERGTIAR